jgi:hypothetical protein
MARFARKQMADLRAMEEQAERENLIDPREVTTEELLSGSGKHKHSLQDHLRHPFKGFGSADEARAAGRHLGEYLGKHHGQRYAEEFAGGCGEWVGGCGEYSGGALGDDEESGNISMSGSYRGLGGATPSMGLSEVRGGGAIVGGIRQERYRKPTEEEMKKRKQDIDERFLRNKIAKEKREKEMAARAAERARVQQERRQNYGRRGMEGGASTRAIPSYSGPSALRLMKGKCKINEQEFSAAEKKEQANRKPTKADEEYAAKMEEDEIAYLNKVAEKNAKLKSGSGKPKRTNARAAVVKKVMADKGLSMIEASKYVKEHNLY